MIISLALYRNFHMAFYTFQRNKQLQNNCTNKKEASMTVHILVQGIHCQGHTEKEQEHYSDGIAFRSHGSMWYYNLFISTIYHNMCADYVSGNP